MYNHENIHWLQWKYAKGKNIKQSPAGGVDAGLDLSRYTKGEEIDQQTDHGVNEEEDDDDLERKDNNDNYDCENKDNNNNDGYDNIDNKDNDDCDNLMKRQW